MIKVSTTYSRKRWFQLVLIAVTILVGLLSRTDLVLPFVGPWLGDLLYAVMVYFIIGFLFLHKPIRWIASVALAFCFLIEFGQLIDVWWLVEIRNNSFGALVLGSDFSLLDLMMYSFGVCLGSLYEALMSN